MAMPMATHYGSTFIPYVLHNYNIIITRRGSMEGNFNLHSQNTMLQSYMYWLLITDLLSLRLRLSIIILDEIAWIGSLSVKIINLSESFNSLSLPLSIQYVLQNQVLFSQRTQLRRGSEFIIFMNEPQAYVG